MFQGPGTFILWMRGIYASIIETLRCIHPSAYAASLITSSSGARNGMGAPCNIGSASMASRRLGKRDGRMLLSADPTVCTSRCAVIGGTKVCTIFKEPSVEDSVGEDGT